MLFRRVYCEPLAQAAYLIADGGDAVVVDPPRHVDELLAFAARQQLRIRWALATHVHADFVAGLRELAAATGAAIGMGDAFDGGLACERLPDGAVLHVGGAALRVLATPGHTPESVSFLVLPPVGSGEPQRLCSGDTLFLGDVGRPDLVAGRGRSPRAMAAALFRSLHERLAPLPDDVEVWPAHGAGSACGTAIAREASSTLGLQRLGNWAFGERDEDRFCDRLLGALRPPPRYFARVAAQNRDGAPLLDRDAALPVLDAAGAAAAVAAGALVLDVRSARRHADGHWPGALHAALDGSEFETWVGSLLPDDLRLVLHVGAADPADAQGVAAAAATAATRLQRIGLETAVAGVTAALPAAPQRHDQLEAADLFVRLQNGEPWQVVDVRRPDEFAAGHIAHAVHAELGPDLAECAALRALDRSRPTAVVCQTGYRSSAATLLLRGAGFTRLGNVADGMAGWLGNHLPVARGEPARAAPPVRGAS